MEDREMLVRIDERTAAINLHVVEMVKHLEHINGTVATNITEIALLKDRQCTIRKTLNGIIAGLVGIVIAIVLGFLKTLRLV